MAVRLTHRQRPDLQSYTILALGATYAITGQAATLRAGRKLVVPDRIPYSLTGYAATLTRSDPIPSWISTPTPNFIYGVANTYDLTQHVSNFNSSNYQMQLTSGTLPAQVTLDPNGSYVYAGGGSVTSESWLVLTIVNSASADWTQRSTANGVIQAVALSTQAELDIYGDGTVYGDPRNATLDTSIYPSGQVASAKISVLNTDGPNSGSIVFTFPQTFGAGTTFWVSYRFRVPPSFAYQAWPFTGSGGPNKLSITSQSPFTSLANQIANIVGVGRGSNTPWECVIQATNRNNVIGAYHQDGDATALHEGEQVLVTPCSSSDIRGQSSIDRSVYAPSWTNYPLTGTNPDNGAAWTACEQARRQYSELYSAYSTPGTASYRRGFGDPLSAGMKQFPNEWITITQRITVGTFGSPNSSRTIWVAREGLPYEKISDESGIQFGGPGPFDGHWLLPYVSTRLTGGRKISSRTSNITGATLHSCGLETPIGNGTLEYNATTQRFRWLGFGESYGPTRGFSAANNKLTFNVESAGAANSYLVVEVNPATLPSSGTLTDTVTIADGRPDTYINYAEYILSTSAINAPGGYAPT